MKFYLTKMKSKCDKCEKSIPFFCCFFFFNNAGILPSCSCESTTGRLDHLDSNKTLGEKSRWELNKHVICCFEHIMKAAILQNNSCMATYCW